MLVARSLLSLVDPAAPEANGAADGIARVCGAASGALLILATLGVSLSMGTSALLILTRRNDVARVCAALNLLLAAFLVAVSIRAGTRCVPIGAMSASMPFAVGIAAFVVAIRRESTDERKRKKDGSEADSG